jgi:hypothetical protein
MSTEHLDASTPWTDDAPEHRDASNPPPPSPEASNRLQHREISSRTLSSDRRAASDEREGHFPRGPRSDHLDARSGRIRSSQASRCLKCPKRPPATSGREAATACRDHRETGRGGLSSRDSRGAHLRSGPPTLSIAIGTVEKIKPLLEQHSSLPGVNVAYIRDLRDFAHAAYYDADRARVVDGMAASDGGLGGGTDPNALRDTVNRLAARWFVLRDVREAAPVLLHVRTAMSWLRGPMTQAELRRALV